MVVLPEVKHDFNMLGEIISGTIRQFGYEACIREEGSRGILEADLVILFGDCRFFNVSAYMLRSNAAKRPKTVIWQIDPFPPPDLNESALKTGLILAKCDRRRFFASYPAFVKYMVPFSHYIQKLLRWILAYKIRKNYESKNHNKFYNIDSHQLFTVMSRYAWLKHNLNLGWIDHLFTSTVPKKEFLENIGIDAKFVPVGYHPLWGEIPETKRDIDILFIGRPMHKTRFSILRDVKHMLSLRGINLVTIDYGCYGQQRTNILNRTKIVLDLIRVPWEMPLMRLLMSMSCGALVVSNWLGNPDPFSRKHLVQVDTKDIVKAVIYYLEHENERQIIVDDAYQFVTQEATMKNSISKIIETCFQ